MRQSLFRLIAKLDEDGSYQKLVYELKYIAETGSLDDVATLIDYLRSV